MTEDANLEELDPLDDFEQIETAVVKTNALQAGPKSFYAQMMKIHDEWIDAGCTPVFITFMYKGHQMLACVSKETFKQKLN